jgi:hypothetical protein
LHDASRQIIGIIGFGKISGYAGANQVGHTANVK